VQPVPQPQRPAKTRRPTDTRRAVAAAPLLIRETEAEVAHEDAHRDERGRWLPGYAVPGAGRVSRYDPATMRAPIIAALWESETLDGASRLLSVPKTTLRRWIAEDEELLAALRRTVVADRAERAKQLGRLAARIAVRLQHAIESGESGKEVQSLTVALGILGDQEARHAGLADASQRLQIRLAWSRDAFGAEVTTGSGGA
jgi:hypothetical protein